MLDNETIKQQSVEILQEWIASCKRHGKVSRNTVAVGIVVLDHLRHSCPVDRASIISSGGEIRGARSGLPSTLAAYGIPANYLKEVTTRQGHQDGQRLLDTLGWGRLIFPLPETERGRLLLEMIDILVTLATDWLSRQNLKLEIDRRQSPVSWVHAIVQNAQGKSGGIVEQHLVGAKLATRFPDRAVANHPAHAGDQQTARTGDFEIAQLVFHVTGAPSPSVIAKCGENLRSGLHPILLVPSAKISIARAFAEDARLEQTLTVASIEDFVALNLMEMAVEQSREVYAVLTDIIVAYNHRLSEVETDLSLKIELR
jgi:hypothetical protein